MCYIVKISFKRIQEFLFAVPRLKAMIGANALLGETIRNELAALVTAGKAVSVHGALTACADDPLANTAYPDDPAALYKKGILSRDGGHFHALFDDESSARNFIKNAQACVSENLPGVRMEASIRKLGEQARVTPATDAMGHSDNRLPQFQICQDTGSHVANHYRKNETPAYVSTLVERLEAKGKAFYSGRTEEIIGLLWKEKKLPSLDHESRIPADLGELAGEGGYIAVIHADGNGMGNRRATYAGASEEEGENLDSYLKKEIANETFFHAMRVAVRKAVVQALGQVFTKEALEGSCELPYQLLMLGGDDLLLVTRPEYAFPFVIAYAEALKKYPIPYREDETRPMSIGAGIAIASHKLPFHHLYDLAENLAGSAKKLFRAQQGDEHGNPPERSVVDWMVSTASWVEGVEQNRRQLNYMKRNGTEYCTSGKPYFVLPEQDEDKKQEDTFNLKTLFDKAKAVFDTYETDERQNREDAEKAARSQMKRLLQPISHFDVEDSNQLFGKMTAVPTSVKALFPGDNLWRDMGDNRQLTRFNDFMELVEIHYLGRRKKAADKARLERAARAAGGAS